MSNQSEKARECHKCPLNGKGDPRCITCPGPSKTPLQSGVVAYSLDSMKAAGMVQAAAPTELQERGRCTDLPLAVEERLLDFLYRLFSLTEQKYLLVRHVFLGGSLSQFGRSTGVSRQRVNTLAGEISTEIPVLAEMFGRRRNSDGDKTGRFQQMEFYFRPDPRKAEGGRLE